ncbi:hypothetical protein SZ54_4029 [Rhizobium sp. UR51a]|jgi:hypothetical protein|nr:hypothetical protein SZ54_4029 [Rhizobium sp. UR51a]
MAVGLMRNATLPGQNNDAVARYERSPRSDAAIERRDLMNVIRFSSEGTGTE